MLAFGNCVLRLWGQQTSVYLVYVLTILSLIYGGPNWQVATLAFVIGGNYICGGGFWSDGLRQGRGPFAYSLGHKNIAAQDRVVVNIVSDIENTNRPSWQRPHRGEKK